jgi:hypothetical protein
MSSLAMNSDRLVAAVMASLTMKGEPVVLVAFLQHRLQRRKADRHGGDAEPVALAEQEKLHRLTFEREKQDDDHHRGRHHVDEEDGLPAVILGEIAADGRADCRRKGDREREHGEPDRLLMGARIPEPRMTPQELVSNALDAVVAGTNDEIVAGARRVKSTSNSSRIPKRFRQ